MIPKQEEIKNLRRSFAKFSKIKFSRVIKLDTGQKLATDKEAKLINDWVEILPKYYKHFTAQEEKAFNEILKLYDLMEKNEDSQRYILNLIASWFMDIKELQLEIKEEPTINEEAKTLISKIKGMLDWSKLDPLFYISIFESMMDSDEKRQTGAHYTSRDNIHKVIDPLFLNDLNKKVEKVIKEREYSQAVKLQEEIAELTFLDPASGGGNFLVETYMCLRELENKLIAFLYERDQKTKAWLFELERLKNIKLT